MYMVVYLNVFSDRAIHWQSQRTAILVHLTFKLREVEALLVA